MSAHAFWATSGCQSPSLVGESVSHQMSTPAKSTPKMPSFRQNGLTNSSTTTNVIASSTAANRLPAPNGASNHTAPNAQAIAMMAVSRTNSSPTQRMNRTRSRLPISATSGFTIPFRPIVGRLYQTPAWDTSIGVSQKRPTDRFLKPLREMKHLHRPRRRHGDECLEHSDHADGLNGIER